MLIEGGNCKNFDNYLMILLIEKCVNYTLVEVLNGDYRLN